jgi:hypothetical protein
MYIQQLECDDPDPVVFVWPNIDLASFCWPESLGRQERQRQSDGTLQIRSAEQEGNESATYSIR